MDYLVSYRDCRQAGNRSYLWTLQRWHEGSEGRESLTCLERDGATYHTQYKADVLPDRPMSTYDNMVLVLLSTNGAVFQCLTNLILGRDCGANQSIHAGVDHDGAE